MRMSFSGNVQKLAFPCMLAAIFISPLEAQNSPSEKSARTTLTYMGTAAWEITDGKTVVLVDPYLTRLKSDTPRDPALSSDPRPLVTLNDFAISDKAVIDAHIKRADFILITHTHIDHVLDMPYIASKTGALVIGTESTANFARDNGVPNSQILTVKGSEAFFDQHPTSSRK